MLLLRVLSELSARRADLNPVETAFRAHLGHSRLDCQHGAIKCRSLSRSCQDFLLGSGLRGVCTLLSVLVIEALFTIVSQVGAIPHAHYGM